MKNISVLESYCRLVVACVVDLELQGMLGIRFLAVRQVSKLLSSSINSMLKNKGV